MISPDKSLILKPMQEQQPLSKITPIMDKDKDNRREKNNSGDSFSFPSTPNQDSDFEFGSLTPSSPSSDPCRTSPADHLFFNGRLLPHSFPFQHPPAAIYDSRATSRTSSIGSKDSFMSSRSNSTNSRSSSCSSARTSSSDSSERKLFYNKLTNTYRYQPNSKMASGHHQVYGSSQRWQYLTSVPALSRDASRRRKGEQNTKEPIKRKKQTASGTSKFGRRILRWLLMACRECHAMEPSRKDKILQENVKL